MHIIDGLSYSTWWHRLQSSCAEIVLDVHKNLSNTTSENIFCNALGKLRECILIHIRNNKWKNYINKILIKSNIALFLGIHDFNRTSR